MKQRAAFSFVPFFWLSKRKGHAAFRQEENKATNQTSCGTKNKPYNKLPILWLLLYGNFQ